MIFRQLTSTGDWTFGAGLANYSSGQQAILLNVKTALLMWKGDCFFSLPGWINWKSLLNVGQQKNLNAAIQLQLAKTYGVMQVLEGSVSVDASTRLATATYTIVTVYSQQVTNRVQILSGQIGN